MFNWPRETISGAEINEELSNQFGSALAISVSVDVHKQYDFKKAMLPYHCNRCGNNSSSTPQMLLSSFELKGFVCTKCGNMDDEQLKVHKENLRNQAALKLAQENGDLDKDNSTEGYQEQTSVVDNATPEQLEDLMAKVDDDPVESAFNETDSEEEETLPTEETEEDTSTESTNAGQEEVELTEEEIAAEYKKSLQVVIEKLKYQPIDSKFNLEDEGGFTTKCMICGESLKFNNFDELSVTEEVVVKGKTFNIHNCPHCINSLKQFGYNDVFKNRVITAIENRGAFIIDSDKESFTSPIDKYKISVKGCQDVIEHMSIHEFMKKYGDMKSVQNSFREKQDKIDRTRSEESKAAAEKATKEEPEIRLSPPKSTSSESTVRYTNRINGANETSDTLKKYEEEKTANSQKYQEQQVFRDDIAQVTADKNPFQFEQTDMEEFANSCFASIITDIARIANVNHSVIINNNTAGLPFVDFETGIRLICVDLDDRSQYKVNFASLGNSVPFSFKGVSYKFIVLYSDSVRFRRTAVINQFVKAINPEVLPYGSKKIIVSDAYNVMYTTNKQFIEEFEKKNSIAAVGKPMNGRVAIVAQIDEVKTSRKSRDALNFLSMMEYGKRGFKLSDLNNEYDTYMVASMRYIEQFNKDTNTVMYTITDYTEVSSTIVADGIHLCLGAIMKEYAMKHPDLAMTPPMIIFEKDPNSPISPSMAGYIEKETLKELDPITKYALTGTPMSSSSNVEHVECYVKLPEMRNSEEDNCRQDIRLFTAQTLVVRMGDELKVAGITSGIRDPNVRRQFIKGQGYVMCHILPVKEFMVSYDKLFVVMCDNVVMSMQKLPDIESLMPTGGVVNSNIMDMNPFMMMKFMKMMNSEDEQSKSVLNSYLMGQMMGNNNNSTSDGLANSFGDFTSFMTPEMMQYQMMAQLLGN